MKTRILYALLTVLVCAGAYCVWRYYDEVVRPERQISSADTEQNQLFSQIKPAVTIPVSSTAVSSAETTVITAAETIKTTPLADAAMINSSVVGWITIPDTHIDFPIAQAEDNDFYLHNGFDMKYNYELGCPFLDYRCASDFSGFNSIVYAHHMTQQRMFADIALFKDSEFMASNPVGQLTLHDGVHTVSFFAYLNVPYDSMIYQVADTSEHEEYLDDLFAAADYATKNKDDIKDTDRLLLLSTCTYEYKDARGVLVGLIGPTIEQQE
ncbi:class B sortase [Ruminococcus flavefaciens]|uniref:Sortase B n=1 Tax=Ruminococcus flavefaciens TaxID=1265 RepID=A0A1M7LSX6_RUMFL|nr:class B sortase [Ruminococcus flavefaciens]SHM81178.1 sortase B [Ruminococcus flavefaciens]